MGARPWLAALSLVVAAASACSRPAGGDRNLVLITLDTTRADRLGCYGSQSVQTPNLDRIAAGGTVFELAFAVAPITAPSHASMLSGTFPPFHQVRDNDIAAIPEGLPWLPEILRQRGFTTAAMVAAFPVRAAMGFSRGFDYFGDQLEAPPGSFVITNLHTVGVVSRPGERISEEFTHWLEANRQRTPFFVWLHYFDPHWPWEARGGFAELYPEQPYDGEVAYMDDCIGRVLRALDEAGLGPTTGVVAVGDHGEGLMDHGELTHALLLYNATLRVPLIVNLPWLERPTPRVDACVSNADVMPTILEALGVDPSSLGAPIQARSLLPLMTSAPDSPPARALRGRVLYFETFYPFYHYRWSPLSGSVRDGRKLIHGPADELYDLLTDPGESRPLDDPAEVTELVTQLQQLERDLRTDRPPRHQRRQTREELAQLQALGYVGSVVADDPEEVTDRSSYPHPREAMPTFFKYNDILGLIQRGRLAEALDLATSIAEADPRQKDARLTMASLSVQLGRHQAADRVFARLVEDFADKDVLFRAGRYFQSRGETERARDCYQRLLADDPGDLEATTHLAELAVGEGKLDEARHLLEVVLTTDPTYREAMLALAVTLDRLGREDAEDAFRRVADRYPFDPRVNYDYGVFLYRRGHTVEAVERLRRTTTFSGGALFAAAQLALAAHHERRGELELARACLREVLLQTDNPVALREAQARLAALDNR